jgi:tripartite ATP-independent transporter DctP family solute receptor
MTIAVTRKQFLIGAAAAVGTAGILRPGEAAAENIIKLGIDLPVDHPTTKHLISAGDQIRSLTNSDVTIQVFPSNQLGDDTHMLSALRSGAIQMMGIGDNILSTLVRSAAIDNIGFAFKDAKTAWEALDGAVGDIVRADIERTGLQPMRRIWDEGFRQITSSTKATKTPDDLHGFKIRVPPSPISLSLFQHLGAAPTTLNVAELYTALQTHVVDGQENPLGVIEDQKFYQVQKYCSLTNHMWVGYWMLVNGAVWKSLPAGHQKIIADAFDEQALAQRTANESLNSSLEEELTKKRPDF